MKYSDKKIGSAYIYIHIYHIYPIHILYTLRWWFHLGSAYLHIIMHFVPVCHSCRPQPPEVRLPIANWIRGKPPGSAKLASLFTAFMARNCLQRYWCKAGYGMSGWQHLSTSLLIDNTKWKKQHVAYSTNVLIIVPQHSQILQNLRNMTSS